jgi:hypothetical protein
MQRARFFCKLLFVIFNPSMFKQSTLASSKSVSVVLSELAFKTEEKRVELVVLSAIVFLVRSSL